MGVLFNKRTGNFYIRVKSLGKEYEKVIGPRKIEAEIALSEIQQEIRIAKLSGQDWDGFAKIQKARKPRTFSEAAKEYMDNRDSSKASTKRTYGDILKNHLLPRFGSTGLPQIKHDSIMSFRSQLGKKGLSNKRINNILGLLGYILQEEKVKGTIKDNPYDTVKQLPESKPDVDPLSEEELTKALAHVSGVYKPLLVVLAYTGARPSEMFALRWSDIDWKNNDIRIDRARVRGAEGTPKTKSSKRIIPMLPIVRATLEELKAKPVQHMTEYVFVNSSGKPLDDHMNLVWKRALHKAGIKHRPSYQLRHTFASLCLQKGRDPGEVASYLGHATLETFFRHYARWIKGPSQDRKAEMMKAFAITPPNTAALHCAGGLAGGSDEPRVVGLRHHGQLHEDGGEGGILQ